MPAKPPPSLCLLRSAPAGEVPPESFVSGTQHTPLSSLAIDGAGRTVMDKQFWTFRGHSWPYGCHAAAASTKEILDHPVFQTVSPWMAAKRPLLTYGGHGVGRKPLPCWATEMEWLLYCCCVGLPDLTPGCLRWAPSPVHAGCPLPCSTVQHSAWQVCFISPSSHSLPKHICA